MLEMLIFAIVCAIFVFSLRKRRKILSYIIAIEASVLVLLFTIMSLSVFGLEFVKAFNQTVSLFGLNISSMTLIVAALFLMTLLVTFYAALFVVNKLRTKGKERRQTCPASYIIKYKPRVFYTRRIYLLHCRLNN